MGDEAASDVKHHCCDAFEKAKQDGSDNEEYEPLVYVDLYHDVGTIKIGSDKLPPIQFCPWCGAKVEAKES